MDSRYIGAAVVDEQTGMELLNASHVNEIDLPVISFTGDDSSGEFSVPKLSEDDFSRGALGHSATQVRLIRGYTHLDITAATRNYQPDLAGGYRDYNACAVYSFRFMNEVAGW